MNDFQKSLDRYLTSEPSDNYFYDKWYDECLNSLSEPFYEKYENQIQTLDSEIDNDIEAYFNDGLSPQEAADKLQSIYE